MATKRCVAEIGRRYVFKEIVQISCEVTLRVKNNEALQGDLVGLPTPSRQILATSPVEIRASPARDMARVRLGRVNIAEYDTCLSRAANKPKEYANILPISN